MKNHSQSNLNSLRYSFFITLPSLFNLQSPSTFIIKLTSILLFTITYNQHHSIIQPSSNHHLIQIDTQSNLTLLPHSLSITSLSLFNLHRHSLSNSIQSHFTSTFNHNHLTFTISPSSTIKIKSLFNLNSHPIITFNHYHLTFIIQYLSTFEIKLTPTYNPHSITTFNQYPPFTSPLSQFHNSIYIFIQN